MDSIEPSELVDRFHARTLPKPYWTHEAHVIVCWFVLQPRSVDEAIDHLRSAISSYNEETGVANTETSGYHETLTRYYVGAVSMYEDEPLEVALAAPECTRGAPLAHWSRDELFSVEARLGWRDPDLTPLLWEKSQTGTDGHTK